MKNEYLYLVLLFLIGVVFLGGCAQLETVRKKPSPVVSSQPPLPLSEEPTISPAPQPTLQPEVQPQSPPPPEASKEVAPPAPVEESPFIHKVRWPGETLNRISWWYTGAGKNWQEIVKANQALDPRRIMIGDEIIIPRNLLTRKEPMTRDYRTPVAVREELEEIEATTQAVVPQTVDLFGPIDTVEQSTPADDTGGILPLESLE